MFAQGDSLVHIAGISSLIGNIIAYFVGIMILIRAIKTKNRMIFLMFLTVIFTISAALPTACSYINWLLTGNYFSYELYVLLGMTGVPIAPLSWLDIYLSTVYPSKRKIVLLFYLVFSLIFEIYLYYFTLIAPISLRNVFVATYIAHEFDITYKGFIAIYLAISLLIATITGIHFSLISMKSEKETIRLKGKFLLIAFILMAIGVPADVVFSLNEITIILFRIILICSTLCFYIGFLLPKRIERLLLKNIASEIKSSHLEN
ncbi:MAG: hypothetical protein ACP6IY_12070 [Promethearchaeia archaeon]